MKHHLVKILPAQELAVKLPSKYKEGIHYHMEGERIIFTALFHIQRGQCCGTGCRHCPYNPKHKKGSINLQEKYLEKSKK
jgi:hypothetical protein